MIEGNNYDGNVRFIFYSLNGSIVNAEKKANESNSNDTQEIAKKNQLRDHAIFSSFFLSIFYQKINKVVSVGIVVTAEHNCSTCLFQKKKRTKILSISVIASADIPTCVSAASIERNAMATKHE